MSNHENDELTNHEYDGIQEYDNPLPTWWLATFLATIIFSFLYFIHYEFGGGQNLQQELVVKMTEIEKLQSNKKINTPQNQITEETYLKAASDLEALSQGKAVYDGKCAACHGDQGQGLVGPNLTDNYWLHGQGQLTQVAEVISVGVPEKGMPPWGTMLKENEMLHLVAYVHSLHGKNPPNAKAPQGELVQ